MNYLYLSYNLENQCNQFIYINFKALEMKGYEESNLHQVLLQHEYTRVTTLCIAFNCFLCSQVFNAVLKSFKLLSAYPGFEAV